MIPTTPFLRAALLTDATASAATGLLMTAGAGLLAGPLGLPAALLMPAGVTLFPFAAFVAFVATRAAVAPAMVWAVVALNVLWVVESFGLLASGQVAPTLLGTAFVAGQALAVAGFAAAEYMGLRRATAGTIA